MSLPTRSWPLVPLFLLLGAAGCGRSRASAQTPVDNRPRVTVAQPLQASVTDFSEHTGRAEAPQTVEIRARASGHLVKVAFREGELVKRGDLLFVVDPRPYQAAVDRARAELAGVRADAALARRNAARNEQLFKSDVISQQVWDAQKSSVEQLQAREGAAAAALSSAQLDLDYAFVHSPISGRIGRTLVTVGNLISPGLASPLATVVSVDPLYVYVDVDEVRAQQLRSASAPVAQVGFPGEEGHLHRAPIDFIDNRVDAATGTLKLRAVVANPDGKLTDGLFARVRLTDGSARDALLISDRAVGTDQDHRFVWVVGSDGKAVRRDVKLGPLEDGLRVVREGLRPDESVVVRGLQRIRPGVAVAAEQVSMRAVDGTAPRAEAGR